MRKKVHHKTPLLCTVWHQGLKKAIAEGDSESLFFDSRFLEEYTEDARNCHDYGKAEKFIYMALETNFHRFFERMDQETIGYLRYRQKQPRINCLSVFTTNIGKWFNRIDLEEIEEIERELIGTEFERRRREQCDKDYNKRLKWLKAVQYEKRLRESIDADIKIQKEMKLAKFLEALIEELKGDK